MAQARDLIRIEQHLRCLTTSAVDTRAFRTTLAPLQCSSALSFYETHKSAEIGKLCQAKVCDTPHSMQLLYN